MTHDPRPTTASAASPALLSRRYRLLREIGRGGMAAIWEAHDPQLDRRVAVKVLHPQFAADPEFLERFRREARAAAALAHPNIVGVFDVGQQPDGTPFIVMELVEGESLKQRLRRDGPLPGPLLREVGAALAAALDYAHRRGLVHRDVKPQNVLLDADGRVRLTDFGIAQALSASGLTRTGAIMGSVHYMAPEVARGQAATPASDVYSLGATLFEAATGRPPFTGDTDMAVALAHVEQAPVPPRRLNPQLAPDLERTILRALAKRPTERFGSAAELAQVLRHPGIVVVAPSQHLPRPIAAPPPPSGRLAAAPTAVVPRARRGTYGPAAPPHRRGGGAGGAGLVALLLVLAGVLFAVGLGFFGLASLGRQELPARPTAVAPIIAPQPTPLLVVQPTPPPTATPDPTATPAPFPTVAPPPAVVPTQAPPVPTPRPTTPAPTATRPAPTRTPTPVPATPTPRTVSVPSVVGQRQEDAERIIRAAGLEPAVQPVKATAERGTVIAQRPDPGAPLRPGEKVTLSVSR